MTCIEPSLLMPSSPAKKISNNKLEKVLTLLVWWAVPLKNSCSITIFRSPMPPTEWTAKFSFSTYVFHLVKKDLFYLVERQNYGERCWEREIIFHLLVHLPKATIAEAFKWKVKIWLIIHGSTEKINAHLASRERNINT